MYSFRTSIFYFFIAISSIYSGGDLLRGADLSDQVNIEIRICPEGRDYGSLQEFAYGVVSKDTRFQDIKEGIVQMEEVYKEVGREVRPITNEDIKSIYMTTRMGGLMFAKEDQTVATFLQTAHSGIWQYETSLNLCISLKNGITWSEPSQGQSRPRPILHNQGSIPD